MPDHGTIAVSNPGRDFVSRSKEGLDLVDCARVAVVGMYLAQDREAGSDVSLAT